MRVSYVERMRGDCLAAGEALPPGFFLGGLVEVEWFELLWQGFAVVGGEGVRDAEQVGVLGVVALGDEVAGLGEFGRAGGGVVGVGREEVDPAFAEELVGEVLGFFAHSSHDGACGDLDKDACAEPLGEARWVGLEGRVALGVGEDGCEVRELELVEDVGEAGREAVVGDLDEEIALAVDAEARGSGDGLLDVLVGDVEVGAVAEDQGDALAVEGAVELVDALEDDLGIVDITVVGVGGANDVGYAVLEGHAGHGEGVLGASGTVVESPEEVVMKVNHCRGYCAAASEAAKA